MTLSSGFSVVPSHDEELRASAITDAVASQRGYRTVELGDDVDAYVRMGFPNRLFEQHEYYPMLWIPSYNPLGVWSGTGQLKPAKPYPGTKGKPMKYVSPTGQPVHLDVHPSHRDAIADPTVPLWITEGVKKGDALTSAGEVAVALQGVTMYRDRFRALPDWESVTIRGRSIVICFDSDIDTNVNVQDAARKLGAWLLKTKKAKKVRFATLPKELDGKSTKGVDDFIAAGGQVRTLPLVASPPAAPTKDSVDTLTAWVAGAFYAEVVEGSFVYVSDSDWFRWDGIVWQATTRDEVLSACVDWVKKKTSDAFLDSAEEGKKWVKFADSAARMNQLVDIARVVSPVRVSDLDSEPELFAAANGVINLRTGGLVDTDPDFLMTKASPVRYVPGAKSHDWEMILDAVPEDVRDWLQVQYGKAIIGRVCGEFVIFQTGGGSNGKSTLLDTLSAAAGTYYSQVSDQVLMAAKAGSHSTEMMDLQGVRFAAIEETPEARHINTQRLKGLADTAKITARHLYKRSVTFAASHNLFINTNHPPRVDDTGRAIWRRLAALVEFPYTYVKPDQPLRNVETDRWGDPDLKMRAKYDPTVREAALAWMVDGARRYLAGQEPERPQRIKDAVERWKGESPLVRFIGEYLEEAEADSYILSTELYELYDRWAGKQRHAPVSMTTFMSRFKESDLFVESQAQSKKIRWRSGMSSLTFDAGSPCHAMATVVTGIRFKRDIGDM